MRCNHRHQQCASGMWAYHLYLFCLWCPCELVSFLHFSVSVSTHICGLSLRPMCLTARRAFPRKFDQLLFVLWARNWHLPSFFKVTTHMKLAFSNYLEGCSSSFHGSFELISIVVTVSLFFFCQNAVKGNNYPQEFSNKFLQLQLHYLIIFEFRM